MYKEGLAVLNATLSIQQILHLNSAEISMPWLRHTVNVSGVSMQF